MMASKWMGVVMNNALCCFVMVDGSQISVLEEENARVKEAYENELQSLASQLEGKLKEQQAHEEALKKELAEKCKLEEQVSQITILKQVRHCSCV